MKRRKSILAESAARPEAVRAAKERTARRPISVNSRTHARARESDSERGASPLASDSSSRMAATSPPSASARRADSSTRRTSSAGAVSGSESVSISRPVSAKPTHAPANSGSASTAALKCPIAPSRLGAGKSRSSHPSKKARCASTSTGGTCATWVAVSDSASSTSPWTARAISFATSV